MIESVSLNGFRNFESVTVPLDPLTVMVGANGSGKSNLLLALDVLTRLNDPSFGGPWSHDWPWALLRHYGKDYLHWPSRFRPQRCEFGMTTEGITTRIRLDFDSVPRPGVQPVPTVTVSVGELSALIGSTLSGAAREEALGPAFPAAISTLPLGVRLALDFERASAPSYAEGERVLLGHRGEQLASVIADLAATTPHVKASIEDAVRRVLGFTGHLYAQRAKVSSGSAGYWGHELFVEVDGIGTVQSRLLSEGTLFTIALLTALHVNSRPVVLIDDIDRGLHPRAQGLLIQAIQTFVDENPGRQVVCTTHSPFVLDAVPASAVRVLARGPDGLSRSASLVDHPDWWRWKDDMLPGEFWSSVGDEWPGHVP